ncbi:hypothetical protein K439DRAFT_1656586 [Ramaria rubella]|nr:hypothetical protein K439DRAFT_1656586 [Ramaria rubella]
MAPFILKFKGNKSFVAFHNMNDGESLTKTWKVCTKVAAHLEQGQRLENLSWRLWHLHNIMVESDNAKSKREFKKLSRNMGDKLDREKGKNIEELRAPGYKRTQSSDKMRRRAEEIERLRDGSQTGGGMRRMQFTFSLDTPTPSQVSPHKAKLTMSALPVKKQPAFKEPAPKASLPKNIAVQEVFDIMQPSTQSSITEQKDSNHQSGDNLQIANSSAPETRSPILSDSDSPHTQSSVRLPGIFSSNFGPTAILYPSPSFAPSHTYGEDVIMSYAGTDVSPNGGMGISRPTIELPLDELLDVDGDSPDAWGEMLASIDASQANEEQPKDNDKQCTIEDKNNDHDTPLADVQDEDQKPFDLEFEMAQMMQAEGAHIVSTSTSTSSQTQTSQQPCYPSAATFFSKRPNSDSRPHHPATTLNPMALHHTTPTPSVSNSTSITNSGTKSSPGATVAPTSTPAGTKTECSNCGATHTPLWRRGLNDELNCNACGLYCKLHKRPRPKSMRAQHGDNARNNHNHSRSLDVDVIGAKCFNCNTTATPLWRKDDEGKTVCNACGLYYKLHGTNRPLSMKSDVIRKRSRHEIRRAGLAGSSSETPSASPGASRRASPTRPPSPQPPTEEEQQQEELKTPQFSYDYTSNPESTDYATKNSPSNDMLSSVSSHEQNDNTGGPNLAPYSGYFPGPYHPDYLYQDVSPGSELHPIQTSGGGESSEYGVEDRGNKRRRLSSASYDSSSTPTDPPPSATSLNSSNPNRSPSSSPSFPTYGLPYPVYSYQGFSDSPSSWMTATKLHPPMALPEDAPMEYLHPPMVLPAENNSTSSQQVSSMPSYLHPPMLPVEEAAMTYLHPPMLPQANSPIVGYSHPPMLPSFWTSNDPNMSFSDHNDNHPNEASNNMEMFESMMNPME